MKRKKWKRKRKKIKNKSILWQIQINQFSQEQSKASLYNNAIKRERSMIEAIFNQEIQFNNDIKADFTSCFGEAKKK